MTTNRRILVDNSTLSGVERLTGRSKIINLNNIDNDILCLEKLITAILFSDNLIGVDDYKDEYKSSRLKNFEFISFLKIDDSTYKHHATESAKFAKSMVFSLDGSRPAGDIVNFFESIKIDTQMRWEIFVSSEYLTLSFLASDYKNPRYERAIDSAFRHESSDREFVLTEEDYTPTISVKNHPEINDIKGMINAFSSGNDRYSGQGSRDILRRIIFGYGWSAERSHFYNSIAEAHDADAFLAPLRDAFCESCCRISSKSQVNSLIDNLRNEANKTLIHIVEKSGNAKFAVRLPFFTSYFISKVDSPQECIELALEKRMDSEFTQCRTILHNLSHLSTSERYKETNGIFKYLEQSCDSLMKKYGVSTGNGLQFSISLGISGINFTSDFKLNQLLRSYKNRPFARVFRNMAQDMLNVERMGILYDKLCSSIREHADATHPKIPVTAKFMENRENEYSRPAEI